MRPWASISELLTTGNMEVHSDDVKQEDDGVIDREKSLQKTVFKLQKKKFKTKEKLKLERIKVKALEKEVEVLRSKLMVYQTREQEVLFMEVVNGEMEVEPLGDWEEEGEEYCGGDRWEEWRGDGWEEVGVEQTKISYKNPDSEDSDVVDRILKKQLGPSIKGERALKEKVLISTKKSETKKTILEKRRKTEESEKPVE